MSDIRDAAINCEVVKIGMSQDKNGHILKLAIHPNDLPQDLVLDQLGSRYVMALVKLNDQDEPVKGEKKREADNIIASAGALCRNKRFQAWLVNNGNAFEVSEASAVEAIRDMCEITSRSEFSTSQKARDAFIEIRNEFERDYKRGLVE